MSEQVFKQLAENVRMVTLYIGVVGPARVKSTFVKKVMETIVLPNIAYEDERRRALGYETAKLAVWP